MHVITRAVIWLVITRFWQWYKRRIRMSPDPSVFLWKVWPASQPITVKLGAWVVIRNIGTKVSLVPRPLVGEEKGPGTPWVWACRIYGEFSSIIFGMPLLPRGWVGMDNILSTWSLFYIERLVKLQARSFERLLYGRLFLLSSYLP